MSTKVTIKDISRISGYSIGTVDRALNNRSGINAQTKETILKIAAELGYEVNRIAQSLARKTYQVLVIVPSDYPGIYDFYRGVVKANDTFKDYNIRYIIKRMESFNPKIAGAMLKYIDDEDCDGFIIPTNIDGADEMVKTLKSLRKPIIGYLSPMHPLVDSQIMSPFHLIGEMIGRLITTEEKVLYTAHDDTLESRLILQGLLETAPVGHVDFKPTAYHAIADYRYIIVHHGKDQFFPKALLDRKRDHIVIATHLTDLTKLMLLNGQLNYIIDQNLYRQGFDSAKKLFQQLVFEKKPDERIYIRPEFVIKENLQFFID